MSRIDAKKCRAIVLCLLVVGHSALRSHEAAKIGFGSANIGRAELRKAESGLAISAEAKLHKSATHCWFHFGCKGFGCAHRPLPLDVNLSAQCRPSDEYMLSDGNINHFVQLNADLLEEASVEYNKSCAGLNMWQLASRRQWRCMRLAGHMLRASRFLARAMGEMERANLTAIDKILPGHMENAVRNLAEASEIDSSFFTTLKEKWCTNSGALLTDPRSHIKVLVGSLVGIVSGNETEMAKAKYDIDEMQISHEVPSAEQLAEIQHNVEEEMTNEADELDEDTDLDGLLSAAMLGADASQIEEDNGNASSLLMVDNTPGPKAKKSNIFVRAFKKVLYLPLKVHPVVISVLLVSLTVMLELYVLHSAWHMLETNYFHHATGSLTTLVEVARYFFYVIPLVLFESLYHVFLHKWVHHAKHLRDPKKNYVAKDPKDFDCDEDIETWQQDWSRRKMIWCCNTESKGCMAPGVPGVPLAVNGAGASPPSGARKPKLFFRYHAATKAPAAHTVTTRRGVSTRTGKGSK